MIFYFEEVEMIQRFLTNVFYAICVFLCWIFVFTSSPCFAQTNSLQITIDSVSIQNTTLYRGISANFPSPVLSLITVKDKNSRYVHGLADTSRWLSPSDTTQLGFLVDDVWDVLLEYHKENTMLPANKDIKQTTPEYMVTEIFNEDISAALVMDYSGSIEWDIEAAEEASRVFVRQMRKNDRAALIKISDSVMVFQEFTSDTTLLMNAIAARNPYLWQYTPIYDGIYKGITLCLDQPGRRIVVAYTDGDDNRSVHTMDQVVDYAKANGIMVFTIGIGNVRQDALRTIAESTGGIFWNVATAKELGDIYIEIYGLMRGSYVLAHSSTDPETNGTWRIVDVTLKHGNEQGRGVGEYFVPYIPLDVEVLKKFSTDSVAVFDSDMTSYVAPGDTIGCEIQVINHGPVRAWNVTVVDLLADSMLAFNFTREPQEQTPDSIQWRLPEIGVGDTTKISFQCLFDTLQIPDTMRMINRVLIRCNLDTFLLNNQDSAVVNLVPLLPPDISVKKQGVGDSLVVSHGDSTWYLSPGDTVFYTVSLINQGQIRCHNITVQDILPERVTLLDFSENAFIQRGDTLLWALDYLDSRGARKEFFYSCRVDTFMPPWVDSLMNQVTVTSPEDTILWNNSDQDTVLVVGVVPPDPEVRVSPSRIGPADSVQVEVMTPVPVESWDIRIFFENGSWVTTYGDLFIQSHVLTPNAWTTLVPDFDDTRMRTNREEERVGVLFETKDFWNVMRSDTAYFTITSSNEFWLDENVFRPGSGIPLGMRFKLSSNRRAEIVVYDISGGFVKKVADGPYLAGWNTNTTWDGKDENGLSVGSGIYVAILISGDFKQARKFILVW